MTPRPLVYLVRHAEAEREPAHDDAARPLSEEGRARFRDHARDLAREIRIARILTSPYRRARETADLLAAATGAAVEAERRLAAGTCGGRDLLSLARSLGGGVALVGHNPEVAEAVLIAAGEAVEVKPGTVAAVEVEGEAVRLVWARRAP
ncbi:MAG TPA: histidine phosphatase family protein [Anaeromyxobacteraceae bacterium]|nr:histidine phosphatase family protein [Anaeromyxobacteraceae bacterium]